MDALHTDLYQLTMAAGYFHRGLVPAVATCEMFVRRLPRRRRFLLAMGLERVLGYLESLRFTEEQIAYLGTVPSLRDAMTPAFADYLRAFRFTGDVWAMPEGTAAFAHEPLYRVRAPIVEAQIIETYLLSAVNHATMIASKAARVVIAAGEAPGAQRREPRDPGGLGGGAPRRDEAQLLEFGSRRTHPEAAVDAARAAWAAGFAGTSNVEAGLRFGMPVMGTAAHMWTMAHPSEEAAFEGYVATFPSAAILLVDTYDTLRGAERAARIAREKLRGVRLDSGDLLALSRGVREILDAHGCASAKIVASGDLNEHRIAELRRAGAPIDIYGVGTDLVCSIDAPALGGVYKLVELERDGAAMPIAKFSEGKATLPGPHQVHRFRDAEGRLARDVIALADEGAEGEPLLVPVMRAGVRVGAAEKLEAVRARAKAELASLPAELREIPEPTPMWKPFEPAISPRLGALVEEVRARVGGLHDGATKAG